jgi:hypothetical protein
MDDNKPTVAETMQRIREKEAAKKAAAAERKAEREESGISNKLVIDRTPMGLYTCRYSMRGPVPDELKGFFTRKQRILDIATQRGIPVEEV